MKDISKETKFNMSVETLIALAIGIFTAAGFYFSLEAQIQEAMDKPEPVITRQEYDLKDNAIRKEIMSNRDLIERNFKKLEKIEERLYNLQ